MYTTDALIREHQRQMRQLRKELDSSARQVREGQQRLDDDFDAFRKRWVYEPPKPKKTPLPLRILSILF